MAKDAKKCVCIYIYICDYDYDYVYVYVFVYMYLIICNIYIYIYRYRRYQLTWHKKINRNRDCGLSARKIWSLIAPKLGH